MYVRSTHQAVEWKHSADDRMCELLFVSVAENIVAAALYHPPKPMYTQSALLNYTWNNVLKSMAKIFQQGKLSLPETLINLWQIRISLNEQG